MRNEFKVHILNDQGKQKATAIAAVFSEALDKLEQLDVDGRELALVKTKSEEACFFAKRSMASKSQNQEPSNG